MGILGKLSMNNIKKAIRYCKRNGLSQTVYAVVERLHKSQLDEYTPQKPSDRELEEQRAYKWKHDIKISIIVPAYETNQNYLRQMIDSVTAQTYQNWELVIADASESGKVEEIVSTYVDARIIYKHLKENAGISENTNQALLCATGEYIGLLDHDDIISPVTLYEVAKRLEAEEPPVFMYTDEDKADENLSKYYEPNYKREFNLDLILSNNYICHFSVLRADYIKEARFRTEYDGAQDYDLFLRVVSRLLEEGELSRIEHIDKVLYHWRCHAGSTSENPDSKRYAYEAGRRAVQDFVDRQGWSAQVIHTNHLGFYRIAYKDENILAVRNDVAIVGGHVLRKNKILSGAMFLDGTALYKGMSVYYSGYMHLAAMQQEVDAVDIRCMRIDTTGACAGLTTYYEECMEQLENATEEMIIKMSLQLCQMARKQGYRIIFDPKMIVAL